MRLLSTVGLLLVSNACLTLSRPVGSDNVLVGHKRPRELDLNEVPPPPSPVRNHWTFPTASYGSVGSNPQSSRPPAAHPALHLELGTPSHIEKSSAHTGTLTTPAKEKHHLLPTVPRFDRDDEAQSAFPGAKKLWTEGFRRYQAASHSHAAQRHQVAHAFAAHHQQGHGAPAVGPSNAIFAPFVHQIAKSPMPRYRFTPRKAVRRFVFRPRLELDKAGSEAHAPPDDRVVWLPGFKVNSSAPMNAEQIHKQQLKLLTERNSKLRSSIRDLIKQRHGIHDEEDANKALQDVLQQGTDEKIYFHFPKNVKDYTREHPEAIGRQYLEKENIDKWKKIIDEYQPSKGASPDLVQTPGQIEGTGQGDRQFLQIM